MSFFLVIHSPLLCSVLLVCLPFVLGNAKRKALIPEGGFWFTLGGTLTPAFNAYQTFQDSSLDNGLQSDGFHAAFGKCQIMWPFDN